MRKGNAFPQQKPQKVQTVQILYCDSFNVLHKVKIFLFKGLSHIQSSFQTKIEPWVVNTTLSLEKKIETYWVNLD
jgi:hypothetical protein